MKSEKLKKINLFFNLDDKTLQEISSFSFLKTYKKDEIIFYEDEKSPYFYGVVFGNVLMFDVDLKGDVIPKAQFGCGEVFGLINQIQNRTYCLSAKSETETLLLKIDYLKFQKYLSNEIISNRLIKMLSNHIVNEIEFNKLTKFDATKRVVYSLLNFPHRFVKKKKYLLAKELNMSPETLSRILSKLKQAGAICYCEKSIKVIDKKKLEEFV